jgi:death on curing protein
VNPEFLDVEDAMDIHDGQIDDYCGSYGIRDTGLLESAIAQPQASFGGELLHSGIFEMAAAYLFHIIQNHPFVDGNKRTGLSCALTFLEINGIPIDSPDPVLYNLAIDVAEGACGKREAADILKSLAPG